jgi:hypothetical protein
MAEEGGSQLKVSRNLLEVEERACVERSCDVVNGEAGPPRLGLPLECYLPKLVAGVFRELRVRRYSEVRGPKEITCWGL